MPTNNGKTEYKGQTIETLEQPEGFHVTYVTINGEKRRARNTEHAKQLIDVATVEKEPEGPIGGWIKNPPPECTHKRLDKEGFWVEPSICEYHCKININCNVHAFLLEGRKNRIKIQNTNPLLGTCPYCSQLVQHKTDFETVYACGTIGNRLEQTYSRKCKPESNRRRR